MASTKKPKQKQGNRKLQASLQKTPVSHRRLKRPGFELDKLLKMVDLVPPATPDADLPENLVWSDWIPLESLNEKLSKVPAPLRELLTSLASQPEHWIATETNFRSKLDSDENLVSSIIEVFYPTARVKPKNSDLAKLACKVSTVRFWYNAIRSARFSLRSIAQGNFFPTVITTSLLIDLDHENKAVVAFEPFLAAIRGERLDYIRECDACKRIFFAGRLKQPGCKPTCAKKIRQQRWKVRYQDGEYKKYPLEKPEKTKRAQTARKR